MQLRVLGPRRSPSGLRKDQTQNFEADPVAHENGVAVSTTGSMQSLLLLRSYEEYAFCPGAPGVKKNVLFKLQRRSYGVTVIVGSDSVAVLNCVSLSASAGRSLSLGISLCTMEPTILQPRAHPEQVSDCYKL